MRILTLLTAALCSSCVVHADGDPDRSHEWIRRAASRDLGCPMGKLTIHHSTAHPKKKRVQGCGHDVWYVEQCRGQDCDWVRAGAAR
jgi:hypothetical protein